MRKAYDTFLQSLVSADIAAKEGSFDPYRYECAHCGEEVLLAAVESKNMVSHFRHHNGNSDVECELYLGQGNSMNTVTQLSKSRNERAEFYYDNKTKIIYLGLRFSQDQIIAYERCNSTFELRSLRYEEPFFSIHINSKNFEPDILRMIPIEKFSNNYYLSNTLNDNQRKYEVFNNDYHVPVFFKLYSNNADSIARLVRSSTLFTNISYIMIYQSKHYSPFDTILPTEIEIKSDFEFETMGVKFFGRIIEISTKTNDVDEIVMSWGYNLEPSEALTLLWPPVSMVDESVFINSNYVYLYSTFELQSHGNVNVHANDIETVVKGVSKVQVNSGIKIYKKNAELRINKCLQTKNNDYDTLLVSEEVNSYYVVPDNGTYYLFNYSGVVPLHKGMTVLLTPHANIKHYEFGYLQGIIISCNHITLSGELLLRDILDYYRRMENFNYDEFDSIELSDIATKYISNCKSCGKINSAAKHFIKEGLI